jgi:hypothetical protein
MWRSCDRASWHMWRSRDRASWQILIIKPNICTNFSNLFWTKLYMFRTAPLSINRSFSLYTQQWYMSYRFADSLQEGSDVPSWSCLQAVYKTVWHIPLLCVQWRTPDDGQRNCPKHVEFHSKIKLARRIKMFHPDPACKLSIKLYDIYHCCVYSEKLLLMDRGTVQNM